MDAFSVTNDQSIETFGIELRRIPIVIISVITIYLVFLLVRIFVARVLFGLTGFDIVVGIILGSVAGGVIIGQSQPDLTRKTRIIFDEVMSCVRKAGYTNLKRVRCLVLEPSGALNVLGYDETMDPEVLHDVLGSDRVLDEENVQP